MGWVRLPCIWDRDHLQTVGVGLRPRLIHTTNMYLEKQAVNIWCPVFCQIWIFDFPLWVEQNLPSMLLPFFLSDFIIDSTHGKYRKKIFLKNTPNKSGWFQIQWYDVTSFIERNSCIGLVFKNIFPLWRRLVVGQGGVGGSGVCILEMEIRRSFKVFIVQLNNNFK